MGLALSSLWQETPNRCVESKVTSNNLICEYSFYENAYKQFEKTASASHNRVLKKFWFHSVQAVDKKTLQDLLKIAETGLLQ